MADKNIEFSSRKGRIGRYNQDNFFTIVDGIVKIYGLFDGHGPFGHLISGFAMGNMLDFVKNSWCFKEREILDGLDTY